MQTNDPRPVSSTRVVRATEVTCPTCIELSKTILELRRENKRLRASLRIMQAAYNEEMREQTYDRFWTQER